MTTRVIIGEGKPRLMVQTTTAVLSTVVSVNETSKLVYLSGTPVLTDSVLNRYLYSTNILDEVTKGKIIMYNDGDDYVKVDGFDNGFPVAAAVATIKDRVIDLPYAKEMVETFEPVFSKPKTLYHNRKKLRTLLGFYYYVVIDYSNYSVRSMLAPLIDIYDSTRSLSFFFYPRVDNPNIYYECEINSGEYFNIAQHIKNQGHKYVKLSFEGLSLLTQIPLDESLLDLGINQVIVQDDSFALEELT